MSDVNDDNTNDSANDTSQEEAPKGGAENENSEHSSEESLPDWAQKELKRARGEAAKYRTQARDVQDKLKDAKTPEEVAAITKDLAETNKKLERSLMVERVARKHKLPDDLADCLKGESEDELEKHAEKLKAYVPAEQNSESKEPKRLKGGLKPSNGEPEETDPRKLARMFSR